MRANQPVFRLVPVLFLSLLSACALSPQQVSLTPEVTVSAQQNIGRNHPVQVRGKDLRESDVVGSRGGIYADTSLIRTQGGVAKKLASLVRGNLQSRGFNSFNAAATAPQLVIELTKLQYLPASGYLVNRVEVAASLQARVMTAGGEIFKQIYNSEITFKQPITPTAAKNQEMLDQVLTRCINQLLADPQLLQTLFRGSNNPAAANPAGDSAQWSPPPVTHSSSQGSGDDATVVMPGVAPSVAPEPVN